MGGGLEPNPTKGPWAWFSFSPNFGRFCTESAEKRANFLGVCYPLLTLTLGK